jgi:hypothetical protein
MKIRRPQGHEGSIPSARTTSDFSELVYDLDTGDIGKLLRGRIQQRSATANVTTNNGKKFAQHERIAAELKLSYSYETAC